MEEGSVVAALAGMAFVMVGLFQFLRNYVSSSNQDYKKLRDEMEMVQKENIQLRVNNLYWKNKSNRIEEDYEAQMKELQRKLNNCHETMSLHLDKTNPMPDLSKNEDDEKS